MHQSVATIDAPEFINLQPLDINPLMSSCDIKVLYVGENRNHTMITKDVASEMAKTLRGAPIVGYFKEDKEDFHDHGERVIIDDEGIKFECLTTPYGFVAPDAKVWFQTFNEVDSKGQTITREYLMTTGYLWTEQFPECKCAVEGEGRPQSMELDGDTMSGTWSINNGMELFIINDAIFTKLCILGDDVEPCFEGASVKKSTHTYSKIDDQFTTTLFTMLNDLKFALKGEQKMEETEVVETEFKKSEEEAPAEETKDTEAESEKKDEDKEKEEYAKTDSEDKEETDSKEEDPKEEEKDKEEYACGSSDDEKKKDDYKCGGDDAEEKDKKYAADAEDKKEEESDKEEEKKDDEKKDATYALQELQSTLEELTSKYSALEAEAVELREFKLQVENERKDNLIKSFYMLSDEDKQDVITNKANYTLDEIEAKLSVICVRKKVNFDLEDSSKNDINIDTNPVVSYSVEEADDFAPAWIKAVKNTKKNRI